MEAAEGADYFCDGLTDEIITDLSSVHSLRIICRASAMQLKGTKEPPQKIASDLNVRYVLEGSVRLANKNPPDGNTKIRVTTQLIDPAEASRCSGPTNINGTMDDVFTIQESISRQIVSALKIKLTARRGPANARKATSRRRGIPLLPDGQT